MDHTGDRGPLQRGAGYRGLVDALAGRCGLAPAESTRSFDSPLRRFVVFPGYYQIQERPLSFVTCAAAVSQVTGGRRPISTSGKNAATRSDSGSLSRPDPMPRERCNTPYRPDS